MYGRDIIKTSIKYLPGERLVNPRIVRSPRVPQLVRRIPVGFLYAVNVRCTLCTLIICVASLNVYTGREYTMPMCVYYSCTVRVPIAYV